MVFCVFVVIFGVRMFLYLLAWPDCVLGWVSCVVWFWFCCVAIYCFWRFIYFLDLLLDFERWFNGLGLHASFDFVRLCDFLNFRVFC